MTKKWHYPAVKGLSALVREITSNMFLFLYYKKQASKT